MRASDERARVHLKQSSGSSSSPYPNKFMKGSIIWILLLYILLIAYGSEVGADHEIQKNLQEQQPYRTAYHFQPPKNWMNDPNGPMYYKGVYHLFYQYNPYSAVWGNMTWAHSISYDLVDWIHLEHALNPTDPYDFNGCWSGSITMLPEGNPVILYTGNDIKNQQVQNLAAPKNLSDPYLREWVKSDHNPLLTPTNDIEPDFFRDPTTAWLGPDKQWRVVIGSQIDGHGTALLYRSTDFVNWTRAHSPLHVSNKTGMWECPDFYPVSLSGKKGLDAGIQMHPEPPLKSSSMQPFLKSSAAIVEADSMQPPLLISSRGIR